MITIRPSQFISEEEEPTPYVCVGMSEMPTDHASPFIGKACAALAVHLKSKHVGMGITVATLVDLSGRDMLCTLVVQQWPTNPLPSDPQEHDLVLYQVRLRDTHEGYVCDIVSFESPFH